jgi:hypothetical protein
MQSRLAEGIEQLQVSLTGRSCGVIIHHLQLSYTDFRSKSALKNLRNLGKVKDVETASTHTSECSICLMSIAVSDSLAFVFSSQLVRS